MSAMTTAAPAVWIGCLHCYNSGRLVGHWWPATEAGDVDLQAVHRGSGDDPVAEGCEEIWCLDIEGMPVTREMDPAEAARWGDLYTEVGPEMWPALCAWVRSGDYIEGGDGMPSVADFTEAFAGHWSSFQDYALELADGIGLLDGVPEDLQCYVDLTRWARDVEADYSTVDAPGGVYVFRNM